MRIRTGYSFRHAVGHLPDVLSRLQEIGRTAAPITDRNSTFGFTKWTELCKKAELKPIYGVELGVCAELGEKRQTLDYWTFIATKSLRPLHDLIGLATSNPGREPSLTYAQALGAGGLIKIMGERCQLQHCQPSAGLYMALSPALPKGLYRAAKAAGFSFIASSDNVYSRAEDQEFYRVMLGNRFSSTQTYPQYIMDDQEWSRACDWAEPGDLDLALEHRSMAMQSCSTTLQKATLLVPEKPKSLKELCLEGAKALKIDLKNQVYAERLERELNLIAEKQYEDYFFIIADLMSFARQHMIVGPARGSSCGSLICYLTGITSIDPIPFDLIFERFIDTTRTDLPDIDLDFSDVRRELVFDYVEQKYGRDRVARLGTVGMFQPRSALKQTGIALRIPQWRVEKILDSQIVRSSGDSRAMQQLEDTLKDTDAGRKMLEEFPEVLIAGRMEGHPNVSSQHAAGIVITQNPIAEYVAVDARTGATWCDKKDAEKLNLLKIDALGLTQLSIFERTLELVHKKQSDLGADFPNQFLSGLPLDDFDALEVLNAGHFAGVFQFNGMSLQSITKQVQVKTIDDIIAITALARPGPMASGGANSWVKRKNGYETINYPHKVFEPYLNDTLGIVIYQEQILKLGREIGNLSWEDVTQLRKAMSKSMGKEFFDQYGDRWKVGALAKGVSKETADKVWSDLCAYGSWSFNKAHAVAYGLVSYYCCWFKAHYPLEFAAATLDAERDPYKQIQLLRELKDEGVSYVPIDADLSVDKWVPVDRDGNRHLVGPLTAVKGIGPATVREIFKARLENKPLRLTVAKKLANAKTEIDELYPVSAAIKRLHPDLTAINIISEPMSIKNVQCGVDGDIVIIGVLNKIAPKDENELINVQKRGGRVLDGPSAALNLFIRDDTDEIFAKIDRFKFEAMGRAITETAKQGKSIYALKGFCPKWFRMLSVTSVKYLGELS